MDKIRKSKNKYRNVLSFLITLCLTAGLVPLMSIPASANTAIFGGGTGTISDPWLINNLVELQAFRDSVNTGSTYLNHHIRLTSNIILAGTNNWTPIGPVASGFRGTFDGNGYTVSGLNISNSTGFQGFFGGVGTGGTVRNLHVSGSVSGSGVSGSGAFGGIAGRNSGTIENCSYSGSVTATGTASVGGIAGENNSGTIRQTYNTAVVSGGGATGGIAGSVNNGTVTNCYSTGNVSGGQWVGGVVGSSTGALSVVSFSYSTGRISGVSRAGGVVGGQFTGTLISSCIALNPSIITTGGNTVRRVAAWNDGGTMSNTKGRTDTPANYHTQDAKVWLPNHSTNDGEDIEPTAAFSVVFSGFNTSIWNIPAGNMSIGGNLPTLRSNLQNPAPTLPGIVELTVTLDRSGGTGGTANVTVTEGLPMPAITPPTLAGYNFLGYFSGQNGTETQYYNADGTSARNWDLTVNATLYAQWEEIPPVLNIVINDETDSYTVNSNNLAELFDYPVTDETQGITIEDIKPGNTVTITLNISETCNETAPGADKILHETRGRLLQFFEITIDKTVTSPTAFTITRLRELFVPIQITIGLSEELSGKAGYTVYRYHGSEVQLLGMDTDADEYFTVSRGTGSGGTDQVIINARNFSTYAVVENIKTLTDVDIHDDVDVQARIVDLTTPVYMIDIAWGNMKLIYNLTGSAGTWNPETQEYDNPVAKGWSGFEGGNNQVMVSNHSNADVNVSFTMSNNTLAPVIMKILQTNDENGAAAVNMELRKVPVSGGNAPNIEAYLRLSGEPSAAKIEELKNADAWHKVGIITVTITPDGDVLTPLH